ncbi:MAG: efflux RND transporter periplasmic adaptor subunit [Woeseiaceae bacterium]
MNTKPLLICLLFSSALIASPLIKASEGHDNIQENHAEHGDEYKGADEHEGEGKHGDEHGDEHEEKGVTKLSTEQMEMASIVVKPLQLQRINASNIAPGEVRFNTYKTASITPRISAQLVKRHVVLGEEVQKGQPIITLSSVEMAEAQGNVLVVDREWKRVKKLGRKVVSERRYTEARMNWELAKAKVRAYGMTAKQINTLIESKDFSRANGRFELVAPIDGTVLKENFINGQQIEPGQELSLITDEDNLWVLARVTPAIASQIKLGNSATVEFNEQRFSAKVIQISHVLDEVTRTVGIRLSVKNKNDALHSGLFVNARISSSDRMASEKVLALPEAAVMRSPDGDWQVLVEQDEVGEFKGVEIKLVDVVDGLAVIEGLKPGTRVVTQGAFFVQSEIAKSGFEIHNH